MVAVDEHLLDLAAVRSSVFWKYLAPDIADGKKLVADSSVGQIAGDQNGVYTASAEVAQRLFKHFHTGAAFNLTVARVDMNVGQHPDAKPGITCRDSAKGKTPHARRREHRTAADYKFTSTLHCVSLFP